MADSQERTTVLRKKRVEVVDENAPVTDQETDSKDWLGRSLKQLFDNIASEPIPQRIVDKLKELEQKN
jgi:hypothetical protein